MRKLLVILAAVALTAGLLYVRSTATPNRKVGMYVRYDTTAILRISDTIEIKLLPPYSEWLYLIQRRVLVDYIDTAVADTYGRQDYRGRRGQQQNDIEVYGSEWMWRVDEKLGILYSGRNTYFRLKDE